MHDLDDYPDAKPVPGLVVYGYDSPLFFANAEDFKNRALAAAVDSRGPVEWFLLNAEANVEVDITFVDALDELREELGRRGVASSRWPGSSRTCATTCRRPASSTGSARTASS